MSVPAGSSALAQEAAATRPAELPVTRLDNGEAPLRTPSQLPSLPVTKLDGDSSTNLDSAATVSLTLSQPMPLRDMLFLLVRGTPFSIVFDDGVDGTFSGDLKDLTMRQALEAVLFPRGLDYDVQGTLIRVFPRKPGTRLFEIDYPNVRRSVERAMGGSSSIAPGRAELQVVTSATVDPYDELTRGVERLLSPSGRAHVDRAAGVVQVTDFADRLDEIALYLEAVQLRATRQVRLEARVFAVTFNGAASRSIDWPDVLARSGAAVRPNERSAAGVRINDFDAVTSALRTLGEVRVVATPRTLAMNNQPAVMRVGSEGVHFVPLSDGRASTPAAALEGLTLVVTAQVSADGMVQLHIAPSYAAKTGEARGARGAGAPVLEVAAADTLARVHDGDTVVLSGFLSDRTKTTQSSGVAGFFGAQSHERVTSELVILLTPSVVAPTAIGSTR